MLRVLQGNGKFCKFLLRFCGSCSCCLIVAPLLLQTDEVLIFPRSLETTSWYLNANSKFRSIAESSISIMLLKRFGPAIPIRAAFSLSFVADWHTIKLETRGVSTKMYGFMRPYLIGKAAMEVQALTLWPSRIINKTGLAISKRSSFPNFAIAIRRLKNDSVVGVVAIARKRQVLDVTSYGLFPCYVLVYI